MHMRGCREANSLDNLLIDILNRAICMLITLFYSLIESNQRDHNSASASIFVELKAFV